MDIGLHLEQELELAVAHAAGRDCPPILAAALRDAVFPGGARIRPRLVLAVGCALSIAAGFLIGPLMGGGDLLLIGVFLSILLLMMGFVYGPLGAWLPGLFPARVRYTGASVAFNVGGVIGGGFTPVAAQALAQQGGLSLVGVYLSAAAGLSFVALLLLRKPALD